VKLSEGGKQCAASLGPNHPDSQVLVINSVKDVATALGETVNASKLAAGKPINDPTMSDLQKTTKVLSANITSLLKTLKAVDDDNTRGTRAMEATVEAIIQKLQTMQSVTEPVNEPPATPEDLIRVAKNVTRATTKVVAAGASKQQPDVLAAAIDGRQAIFDMLSVCRSVASKAETPELKAQTINAGVAVATSFRDLSNAVAQGQPSDDWKDVPRKVAESLTVLVGLAQSLKGSDWEEPNDPTVIAEHELNNAAVLIEAAAQKLASLKPRRIASADETVTNMNYDEIILEAVKSIMTASNALIQSAGLAQDELTKKGDKLPQDGQWAKGLNSAAQIVATSIHSLVEAAQNLVQGAGTVEMLVSAAKQVASSTAHLLIANKVKSDPGSVAGRRLQTAGNAVVKSTNNLVKAAQKTIDDKKIPASQAQPLDKDDSVVKKMQGILIRQAKVLQLEKELEDARKQLAGARKSKPND
jgi:talin